MAKKTNSTGLDALGETGSLRPWQPHHAPILPQIETGAWAPGRLTGLKNCLPMDAGTGSSSQVLRDMAPGASPTYRGTDDSAESTDPTWSTDGLSFDGGDLCAMGGTPLLMSGTTASVMLCAMTGATKQCIFSLGRSTTDVPVLNFRVGSNADQTKGMFFYLRDNGNSHAYSDLGTGTSYHSTWHTFSFSVDLSGYVHV